MKRLTLPVTALCLAALVAFAASTLAQSNYENTKYKVDQTLRSNARVNPSTLAVELSVPIADMPGRGGTSMPLVLNYSSKVWQLEAAGSMGRNGSQMEVHPRYSDDAMAGWTSSYQVPKVDVTVELYDCKGNAIGDESVSPGDCGAYRYVKRIRVKLPGGTTHELRKDDLTYISTSGGIDRTGTYYAVDGTRVRLEWDSAGSSTLFMPDGGRYFFDSGLNCDKYVDPHGNTLDYDPAAGSWTDTMGRTLTSPIPFTPTQRQNRAEGTQTFEVPGFGGPTRQYQLVWKKLSSGALVTGGTQAYIANDCSQSARSPLLFHSTTEILPCDPSTGYFDPVVLYEIVLPNGQKYQLHYNRYGEIARIDYPTGAYEEFVYNSVKGLGWDYQLDPAKANSYGQANRGVTLRKVSAGDGAAEQQWSYAADYQSTVYGQYTYVLETTAPDGSKTKRFLHRVKRTLQPGYGNFGFDTVLAGMEMETQVLDTDGTFVRSRKLTEWEVTTGSTVGSGAYPERDARVRREITVTFEPGSTSALAAMSETVYDTSGSTDPAHFSSLNAKQSKVYDFVVVSATSAANADLGAATAWFSGKSPSKTVETDYLYDANYKARNISGLAIETRVKDASGAVKARTQIFYDEGAFMTITTGAMPTRAAGTWIDLTDLSQLGPVVGAKRGLPTTVRSYHDVAAGQYVETHSYFDQYGNVTKVRDGLGNETTTAFDAAYAFAYPTGVSSPVPDPNDTGRGSTTALTTSTAYDYETGLPTSTTDVNGRITNIHYTDPASGAKDPLLRVRWVEAPNGQQTITEYGAGTTAATRYVKVKTQLDTNKWKEGYTWFDGLGRTVKAQSVNAEAGDVFVETEYDQAGRPWRTTNPHRSSESVYWTENTFDTAGRPWKVTTADGAVGETTYSLATTGSQFGTVVTVKDQAGKLRRSITNALGQLIRVDEPDDNNQLGAISTPYQPTIYGYDVLNNLLSVQQDGDTTNECGGATPTCSQTRSFVYDAMSRLKQATNPESGTILYTYDDNSNLKTRTDARGVVSTYSYDPLNRVTHRTYAAPSPTPQNYQATPDVDHYYDNVANAKGKLVKVSSSVSATEYTAFDILGRVTAHKQTTDGGDPAGYTTAYTYDLAGGLVEETYPSGRVVKNVVDGNGDLEIVQSKKGTNQGYWNYAQNFTYSAAGAVSSMQLGNGRWESTVFNSRLQPTKIALGTVVDATDLLRLDYSYNTPNAADNNGNILSQTITVPTVTSAENTFPGFTAVQTYTYDSLNRIARAEEKPVGWTDCTSDPTRCWTQAFKYDRYGNRNFEEGPTTTLAKGCAGALCPDDKKKANPAINLSNNRLSTADGYSFDDAGNTTGDANSRTFVYDGENKQTEVRDATVTPPPSDPDADLVGRYWYDGDGKRVKKYAPPSLKGPGEMTVFVYDAAGKLAAEYSTSVAPQSKAKVSYLTSDQIGSPRINTDQSGAVISRHDYHPFGEEVSTTQRINHGEYAGDPVRKQFTGYERDEEAELDFAQARYFAKDLGRFNSPDPKMLTPERMLNPQIINLYVYTANNPLRYVDPDGEEVVQLGRHTTQEIDDRLAVIAQTIAEHENDSGREWRGEREELENEARMLQIEKEGNAVIGAWISSLNATGQNNGMTLSDFVLTSDPENDLGAAARAAGESPKSVADIVKSAGNPALVGTVIAGQIYLLQTSETYQVTKMGGLNTSKFGPIPVSDVANLGGSFLSHEDYHKRNGRSEYDAYSHQEKILDNMNKSNSPFQNQNLFKQLKTGIQTEIQKYKKAEGR